MKIVKTCDVVDTFYEKEKEAKSAGRDYSEEEARDFVNELVWILGETKPCGLFEAGKCIIGRWLKKFKRPSKIHVAKNPVYSVEPKEVK